MKIRDLDNNIVKWSPSGFSSKDSRSKSFLHTKAKKLLLEKYPTVQILEEVSIPIATRRVAYLDFYHPLFKRAYEIHGEQHFKFVPHFHINYRAFINQQNRDKNKELWCSTNKIQLIILRYDNINQWEQLI